MIRANAIAVSSAVALSFVSATAAMPKSSAAARFSELPTFEVQAPTDQVNQFLTDSNVAQREQAHNITVRSGKVFARLQTPLNSNLSFTGDPVVAVVTGSSDKNGHAWLPIGTILEGCVEGAKKANFGQTDGIITVRFYTATVGNKRIELTAAPDTAKRDLRPSHYHKMTKKEQVKGVLMMATRMAVPMAIGSGGLSIAITTGAGAVIGGVLAEKGKHISGAVEGAWQGSGLSVLDPVVRKGLTVKLPEGTPISLQLSEAISVPRFSKSEMLGEENRVAGQFISRSAAAETTTRLLSTHAKIVEPGKKDPSTDTSEPSAAVTPQQSEQIEETLKSVDRLIEQANLAAAIDAEQNLEKRFPDEPRVRAAHEKLAKLIYGASSSQSVNK